MLDLEMSTYWYVSSQDALFSCKPPNGDSAMRTLRLCPNARARYVRRMYWTAFYCMLPAPAAGLIAILSL